MGSVDAGEGETAAMGGAGGGGATTVAAAPATARDATGGGVGRGGVVPAITVAPSRPHLAVAAVATAAGAGVATLRLATGTAGGHAADSTDAMDSCAMEGTRSADATDTLGRRVASAAASAAAPPPPLPPLLPPLPPLPLPLPPPPPILPFPRHEQAVCAWAPAAVAAAATGAVSRPP